MRARTVGATTRLAAPAVLAAAALVVSVVSLPGPTSAATAERAPRPDPALLGRVVTVPGEGSAAAVVPAPGAGPVRPSTVARDAGPEQVARAVVASLAPVYGVDASAAALPATEVTPLGDGTDVVRFQQRVSGVPVLGGELAVQVRDGALLSVTGETAASSPVVGLPLPADRAREIARAAVTRSHPDVASALTVGAAQPWVYDPELLGDDGTTRTVWRVVVAGPPATGVVAEVLVDAHTGAVAHLLDRTEHLERTICDNHNSRGSAIAAGSWCTRSDPNGFFVPIVDDNDPAALGAYDDLGAVSDFYSDVLGVDLTQQVGLDTEHVYAERSDPELTATVRHCEAREACPYPNAFWVDADPSFVPGPGRTYIGGQVYLGDGLQDSLDVVAHEITHGVTASVNALRYENESGAINESMSDVFGELSQLYDPATGAFADSRDPRWLIGEHLDGPTLFGAVRSMSDPSSTTLPEGDPQPNRMTSRYWRTGGTDNGGVHANNGVGNKTAYLIARGGAFNGRSVRGIGDLGTARLYWRVQNLLTSGANYRDLAVDLSIACSQLYGAASSACASVRAATAATQISGSAIGVSASPRTVTYRHGTTIRARLLSARGSAMYVRDSQEVRLVLERRYRGASRWTTLSSRFATTAGHASWVVHPARRADYRVRYLGSWSLGLLGSTGSRTVKVRPAISSHVSRHQLRRGEGFTVTGRVGPKRAGRTVLLQKRSHGSWRTVDRDRLSRSSHYRLSYRPSGGVGAYRVRYSTTRTLVSAHTATFHVYAS